jgi:hypothetical protein
METSVLYKQIDVFTQEDNYLYFALGLAHATAQLEQKYADQLTNRRPEVAPAPPLEEDALITLLLGVISFSRHYIEILDSLDAGQLPAEDLSAASPVAIPDDDLSRPIIRQLLR